MCVSWQHHARSPIGFGKSDRVYLLQFRTSSMESRHPEAHMDGMQGGAHDGSGACAGRGGVGHAGAAPVPGAGVPGVLPCARHGRGEGDAHARNHVRPALHPVGSSSRTRPGADDRNHVLRGLMHRALLARLLCLCVRAVLSQRAFGAAWSAARPTRRGGAHARDPMPS